MFTREANERINKTTQDWERRLVEVRYVGHHALAGAVIDLTPQGVQIGSGPRRLPDDARWKTDGWF